MDKLMELELEEAIDTIEASQVGGRFTIENLDSANWAFRKLAAIERKRSEIKELADKEIQRIKEWQEQEEKGLNNSKEFFEGLLTEYFIRQKEVDPKFKISTPYGKVSSRKQQPKWNYDDKKLIPYLENYNPKLIRIKKEVNKVDFKKAVKNKEGFIVTEDGNVISNETGELIEGVTIEDRPDSITVKVAD